MSYAKAAKTQEVVEELVRFTPDQVWAAAAYAYRINGRYNRESYFITGESVIQNLEQVIANKVLIRQQLDADLADITNEDCAIGIAAKKWHSGRLMIQSLKGPLKSFEQVLSKALAREEFTVRDSYEIAIIASQITAYLSGCREEQVREDIVRAPLAAVGEKVDTNITVVRSIFSQNYGVFFVTAKTDCRHMVFFSYKKALDADSQHHIKGTVKAHRDDSVTQLNRVKIV